MHNNRGQKPITNRAAAPLPADGHCPQCDTELEPDGDEWVCPDCKENFAGADASAANQQNQTKGKTMKNIATRLGLAAEASEDAILAEVTKIQNRVTTLEAKVTPLETRKTELETENQTLLGEQVDALLDAHGIKSDDKVRNRLKPVLTAMKNREERVAALVDFGFKLVEPKPPGSTQTKLHNRDTKPPQTSKTEDAGNAVGEKQQATKIQNRACELQKQMPTLSVATAYRMAQRELEDAS